jgi:hypothetical protein
MANAAHERHTFHILQRLLEAKNVSVIEDDCPNGTDLFFPVWTARFRLGSYGGALRRQAPLGCALPLHIALICFHWHSHRLKVSLIRSTPTEMCGMRFTVWTTTVLIELNSLKAKPLSYNFGGESGIRTHVTLSSKHAFQACAFSHSAISPAMICYRESAAGSIPGKLR